MGGRRIQTLNMLYLLDISCEVCKGLTKYWGSKVHLVVSSKFYESAWSNTLKASPFISSEDNYFPNWLHYVYIVAVCHIEFVLVAHYPVYMYSVLGCGLSVHRALFAAQSPGWRLQPSRGLLALVSPPLMSSRHHNLEPYWRWHATIYMDMNI